MGLIIKYFRVSKASPEVVFAVIYFHWLPDTCFEMSCGHTNIHNCPSTVHCRWEVSMQGEEVSYAPSCRREVSAGLRDSLLKSSQVAAWRSHKGYQEVSPSCFPTCGLGTCALEWREALIKNADSWALTPDMRNQTILGVRLGYLHY